MDTAKRKMLYIIISIMIPATQFNCDKITNGNPPEIKISKIAFASNIDGNLDIVVIDPDGNNKTRLTNNPADDYSCSWSPDGTKIAFTSDRDGNDEIYIMNSDGTDIQRVTFSSEDYAHDRSPGWFPDGTKLIFQSFRDNKSWDLYTINTDGSGLTQITNTIENEHRPRFSPDGSKVLFTMVQGEYGLYTVNIDGSDRQRINDAGFWGDWSPDGSKIVYEGFSGLFMMDSDGTNITELIQDNRVSRWPT